MIKVLNQYFPRRWAVLLLGESCLILLALSAAVMLATRGAGLGASGIVLFLRLLLITLVCQVCLHYSDLYTPERRASTATILTGLLQGLGIATLVLALVYWLLPEARLGTWAVVGTVTVLVAMLLGWREGMDWCMGWAHRMFPAGERLLLVGGGECAEALARELRLHPQLGLNVVGLVAEEDGAGAAAGTPVLGGLDQMAELLARHRPRRIALALAEESRAASESLRLAREAGIRIEAAPMLLERVTGRVALELATPASLGAAGTAESAWFLFYQRATGVLGAAALLVLLSPVMALVALCVRLDSPGPVLYRQQRVGRRGRVFEILKFRSMRLDAESASGPVWAQASDPRITRLGHWLRKLRLDELPQLFNVLRGDMSIVGPRPERPVFVEEFRRTIPFYELRHTLLPGITGWAQVCRDYGASADDARAKLEYDLFYLKNLSVGLDLFILFQTTKIVALGRGAR